MPVHTPRQGIINGAQKDRPTAAVFNAQGNKPFQGNVDSVQKNSGQPRLGTVDNNSQKDRPTAAFFNNQVGNGAADQYKAKKVDAITSEVNAGNETVESRLNNITAKGSRYTRLAAQDARRESNSRGLINSSMSAAAGTEAAIRAALPIAQQDAKTYTDTRFNNQNIQNKFLENRQGANLNQEVAAQGSRLKKSENEQNANLNIKRDAAQSGNIIAQQNNQSGLTNEENTLLNQLTMKRDKGLSALTQQEQDQLNALNIKRDAAQSGNVINQQNNQSGLTQAENDQLNALQMKRDQGLSTLTQAENAQLNDLTMKRDSALADQAATQSQLDNQLSINRDNNSAALNESLATLESGLKKSEMKLDAGLKLTLEETLQGQKFSDNAKMNILASINQILSDYQAQVAQVGLSDRSGAQQAAAIAEMKINRDAALLVYQNMLKSMPGWKWDTDFTPKDKTTGGSGAGDQGANKKPPPGVNYPEYPSDPAAIKKIEGDVFSGAYRDTNVPPSGSLKHGFYGGSAEWWYSSDRKWTFSTDTGQWIKGDDKSSRRLF